MTELLKSLLPQIWQSIFGQNKICVITALSRQAFLFPALLCKKVVFRTKKITAFRHITSVFFYPFSSCKRIFEYLKLCRTSKKMSQVMVTFQHFEFKSITYWCFVFSYLQNKNRLKIFLIKKHKINVKMKVIAK